MSSSVSNPNAVQVPKMDAQQKMQFTIGLGVIGGIFLGKAALGHLFVEGTTSEERKNMLKAAAIGLSIWGLSQLFKQEELWWLSVESISKHFDPQVADIGK